MSTGNLTIKRALVSVSDKTGIVEFCKFLHSKNVEIISTGGTAKTLQENGIPYRKIETVTGNPEAFGGRMKTISFQVGSALLFRRDNSQDQEEAKKLGIEPIDLVICNLYPFEKVAKEQKPLADLIENIDIGGPTMIRAAAKNYNHVACVVSPVSYREIQNEIAEQGSVSHLTREKLALQAFSVIAAYDIAIAKELSHQFAKTSGSGLRYGENPHQQAALLKLNNTDSAISLASARVIQGKELSYNNLLDADQAFKCCSELAFEFKKQSVCVIVKHGTPCGVAVHTHQSSALNLAWESDSISAFGGILCFNQEVSEEIALALKERFTEVIIAPRFSDAALKIFSAKKNLRLLEVPMKEASASEWTVRSINGGLLCQDEDQGIATEILNVTQKKFPEALEPVSRFGLVVTKYLKSNCIGLFGQKENGYVTITSGVGQPNRLDCISLLAGVRAKQKNEDLSEAVLVSDAFFPFRDSIEAANDIGVKYILQPGGSVRDPEVIGACNELGIAMAMTGRRHFRH